MDFNFKDKENIKKFLKRDKHKLLEGMVVEEIFMEDIALPNNWTPSISKGWWSIRNPFNFDQYILFHVSSQLPQPADIDIYKLLSQKNIQYYHVLLVNNDLNFLDLLAYDLDMQIDKKKYISKSEFLNIYGSKSQDRDILLAEESTRNIFNQERAISFFESQSLLKEVALQRYFANYFLTVCLDTYPVNLDAFIIFDNGPAVLEIKFKYPDSGGHYGINKGQAALFRWLMDLGFNIYHYIADNPTGDKKYGVFDLIIGAKVCNSFYWKYKQLTSFELLTNHATAPKETNISGKKPVDYIPISANSFINTQIKVGQHIDTTNIARESCTRSGCSGFREIVSWNNGYFWGCTNFKNHKNL
jgi:hypothetical protein